MSIYPEEALDLSSEIEHIVGNLGQSANQVTAPLEILVSDELAADEQLENKKTALMDVLKHLNTKLDKAKETEGNAREAIKASRVDAHRQ